MPDSLILESPAHPALSTDAPPSASMPAVPFDATALLVRLYREAQAAADALEGSNEEPDGPLGESYGAATDRFIEAPVNTIGDVLLKLEHIAYHEDLEANPRLILNRTLLALLRDLRATDAAYRQLSAVEVARRRCPAPAAELPRDASSLDLKAIHDAADEEVDEIYSIQSRMSGGLLTLKQLTETACKGDTERSQFNFVIDALSDANDELIDANDRLTNAIDPLNPTVLDDGSV